MTINIRALLFVLLVITSKCVIANDANLDLNYQITNSNEVGVVRAFDNGAKTVLVLSDSKNGQPTVMLPDGTPVQYHVVNDYAILPGIEHHLMVYLHGQAGQVNYAGAPVDHGALNAWQPPVSQQPASPAPMAGVNLQAAPYPRCCINGAATTQRAIVGSATSTSTALPQPGASPPAGAAKTNTPATTTQLGSTSQAVAAVADPAPAMPAPVWRAPAGQTLRSVLAMWSTRAGWTTPVWDKNLDTVDYAIPADITLSGTFEDAIRTLMRPFAHATPALKADIWDGNGQHVINIEEKK